MPQIPAKWHEILARISRVSSLLKWIKFWDEHTSSGVFPFTSKCDAIRSSLDLKYQEPYSWLSFLKNLLLLKKNKNRHFSYREYEWVHENLLSLKKLKICQIVANFGFENNFKPKSFQLHFLFIYFRSSWVRVITWNVLIICCIFFSLFAVLMDYWTFFMDLVPSSSLSPLLCHQWMCICMCSEWGSRLYS